MVGTSKVLTVSYGTFSCTLEGFDDSFSTMKAIAEYFRDLASDDRYFGAEPPTPDAEMLARIAQREISRNVEAKIGENGVVLRATPGAANAAAELAPATPAPQPEAAAPEPQHAPQYAPQPVAEAQATIPAPAPAAPVAAPVQAAPSEFEPIEEGDDLSSVAAKLRRIRSVVQHAEAANATSIYSEDDETAAFFNAGDDAPLTAEGADAEQAEAEIEEVFEEVPEEITEDEITEEITEDEVAEVEIAEEVAETDDSDAAISDVMARLASASTIDADEEYEEDLQPEDVTEDSDFAAEIQAETAFENDGDDADAEADEDGTDENSTDEDAPEASDVRIVKVKRDVLQAAMAADSMSDILAPHLETAKDAEEAAETDPSSLSAEDEADLMAELAEVAAEGDDEGDDEDDQIAELEAELAEDNAEDNADSEEEAAQEAAQDDDATDEPDQIGQAVAHSMRRDRRAVLVEGNDDASLSRILEHTNSELQSGEGTRRRAAIAHLKAAVAATVADRKDGNASHNDAEEDAAAYRDDLAQVVRPRRLSAKGTEERPRQAPLMLVSELRIDRPAASDPSPGINVRPRRVTKGNLAIQLDDEEADEEMEAGNVFSDRAFARFAAEKGATQLPDLLEAAAAYACFVEGRPHFSRPQVMKEVSRAQPETTFSREEGLRSFGTLLRQGKIRKLKRGQFVVSEDTRFKPKAS